MDKTPNPHSSAKADFFDLTGRVAVITGGAGLLGTQHALAIHRYGGIPILADIDEKAAVAAAAEVGERARGVKLDVTNPGAIEALCHGLRQDFEKIDILINNAARNPKVELQQEGASFGRFEKTDLRSWEEDLAVGLTGAMLCSRIIGEQMARNRRGIILNVASDLALIGPDQRLYEKSGLSADQQPKKPASYSVVKSGLIGLTRYLATYWADQGVRCNAICPGGVENEQPVEFLHRIAESIPMGRLARVDEYQGAVVFLCSDASSYMNGAIVSVDGGRTVW